MSKGSFFRQSGWMMVATTVSGLFMYAVHIAAKEMPRAEYGVFLTLLQVLNAMTIPAVGLQLSFAQQAVSAVANQHQAKLTAALRSVSVGMFVLWLAVAVPTLVFQQQIMINYKISNPAAIWTTLALGLASLWAPIVMGTLQGLQNFFWMGWSYIINGVTRLVAVTIIVVVLGGYAAGAMFGAVLGMAVAMAVGLWFTREYWFGPVERFEWVAWVQRLLPLTLGFGAVLYMMSLDMIVVQRFFPKEETGAYGAAGMIGRALYFFTSPLAAVMFPKIVHSAATSQKSSVLFQALGATALMGAGAALLCTIFPTLPLRIVYQDKYLDSAPLVPLFAWSMVPVTLSSVLINNLLARERFGVVPWLVAVGTGYYFTLRHMAQIQPQDFTRMVKTLGLFGLIMLAVCLFFTWLTRARKAAAGATEPPAMATMK